MAYSNSGELQTMPAPSPSNSEGQKVANYFESTALNWDSMYSRQDLWGQIHQQRLARFLSWVDKLRLPLGSEAFDVGCGAGLATVGLATRGFFVESIDVAASMVELARKNATAAGVGDRVHADTGDIYNLNFPDQKFSLVLSIGVVPWLQYPAKAVAELSRVLKPGGHLLFTMDNRSRLARLLDPATSPLTAPIKTLLGKKPSASEPPKFVASYQHSLREVDSFLKNAGLQRLHHETLGFGHFTFFYRKFLPERAAVKLNNAFQTLADHRVPVFRSTGSQFLLLTRKIS
jgi:ubiquinone/menaquinone biosynthesis C-methylase UbiE